MNEAPEPRTLLWRALAAFLILPGLFGFVIPCLLAWLDPFFVAGHVLGYCLVAVGGIMLGWCVRDFLVIGKGTLAPWDPPKRLVVVGLYRFVRNPMYVGVLLVVAGWGIALGSPLVAGYGLGLGIIFHVRVLTYEEPKMASLFPADWAEYVKKVRRWLPRMTPWRESGG